MAYGLKIRGIPDREINELVGAGLDRFKIAHLSGRSARKISSGEAKQLKPTDTVYALIKATAVHLFRKELQL